LAGGLVATVLAAVGLAYFAGSASAEPTVWLCKPGEADNPCLGKMDGIATEPGPLDVPLGYSAAEDPPIDCFYLYPTQSAQTGANADLSKDPEIRNVAINQARQFSRICDVYAPMYRQYTFEAPITDEVRDIAYNSALGAWNDYLENYNDGRGVIIVGHSQGSSHMSRLMAEEIDDDAAVRDRMISAIIPGANVYVPKGGVVGGQFQNIPACETGDQTGCVIAYSMYLNQPPPSASFGWVDTGYWINPAPRPDKDLYQVLCVNPADLAGENGVLRPLANLPAFLNQVEPAKPWQAMPDFYGGECRTAEDPVKGTVSWLNVSDIRQPGDNRTNLATLITQSGGNLHLGDINLALDSLITVAGRQRDAWLAAERAPLITKRATLRRQLKAATSRAAVLKVKARKAKQRCRKTGSGCADAKRLAGKSRKAGQKVSRLKLSVRQITDKILSLSVN
jgi:hypothetical protein